MCLEGPALSTVHVLLICLPGQPLAFSQSEWEFCTLLTLLRRSSAEWELCTLLTLLSSGQVSGRANLNSKNTGQVSVRVTSHDKQELAYAFVAPVLGVLWRKLRNRGRGEFDL